MPFSFRMLIGLRPPDLFNSLWSEHEPCAEMIILKQRILVVRWAKGGRDAKVYRVRDTIHSFDGTKIFHDVPETIRPPQLCSLELMRDVQRYLRKKNFNSWDIKGALHATDTSTAPAFLYQASSNTFETHLILIERKKPCNCHKMWKPRHELKVVENPARIKGRYGPGRVGEDGVWVSDDYRARYYPGGHPPFPPRYTEPIWSLGSGFPRVTRSRDRPRHSATRNPVPKTGDAGGVGAGAGDNGDGGAVMEEQVALVAEPEYHAL